MVNLVGLSRYDHTFIETYPALEWNLALQQAGQRWVTLQGFAFWRVPGVLGGWVSPRPCFSRVLDWRAPGAPKRRPLITQKSHDTAQGG